MLFSTPVFLFLFLPVVLTTYFLLPGKNLKNCFLMFASLLFYFWGEAFSIYIMLTYIAINYFFGLSINSSKSKERKKLLLILALTSNLLLLVIFKYANFIVDNLNQILHTFNLHTIPLKKISLPLGISFITFHCISYLVDTYKQKVAAQKNPVKFALYISLFPQLIAGPIIRYHDIAN